MAACPNCASENPEGAKFCNECGAPLRGAPPQVVEERKVVSVLFCDLVGFTAASDRQDPEDVRARIRPYHGRLRLEIERYGGTVEKFVGDAIMAVFGAPVAHEDDAERAIRAALSILDSLRELNDAQPGLDLQVRIGINTGEAVVAVGARPEEGEGLVTGDVVNTAARIESAAPAGAIAVSDQTYRATSRVFEYKPLPSVTAKGKSEPLALWRPIAARARFGSDISRDYGTPFVGRELEKPLLIGTFERAAQQRSVQLVTIVGEPGVGKTRLVGELLEYLDAKPGVVRWRQGRCIPYGEGITFWALGEIVKAEAGILESDSADVAAAKLEQAIPPEETERQWVLHRLAPLVGAEAATASERQELFTAWRRFLEALAASRATVLVFEDLHWGDDALLAFLEYVAEWSQGVPMLILCTARPELYERRPGWGAGMRNAHTINLSPLSPAETAELVGELTRTALEPELERAIVERAGGNPLYAEEFVRLLADRSGVADAAVLPESVHALIAARLDTLAPERKSLLQDAAVVGKVFWVGAVATIGTRSEDEVEAALHELARKELIRPARSSSMEGESEYSFWHALVRDVAYAQIPRAERARRHRAAAAWIEHKAGERVEDLAEVLAYHYVQALELAEAAGDDRAVADVIAPARRFVALAGERALGLDTAQAEERLARALELTPTDDPQRPHLLVTWADAVMQAGRPREAADALDRALAVLRERGETEAAANALRLRSRLSLRLGEGRYVELATNAVELLDERSRGDAAVAVFAQLANAQCIAGAYDEAIAAAERAREIASDVATNESARALGYHGYARALLGDVDGLREMEEALLQLTELGDGRDASVLRNNLAIARYPLQGPQASLDDFERGIAFAEQRGLQEVRGQMESSCAGLLAELGRTDEALARADRVAPLLESRGDRHTMIEVRAVQTQIRVRRGERIDAADVERLVESTRNVGSADDTVIGLTTAAMAVLPYAPERARAVLAELDAAPGVRASSYYGEFLPEMVRTAVGAGDTDLAKRLVDAVTPRYPLDEHALAASRATLVEHDGKVADAAALYAEAVRGWERFGNVREHAYALLGHGRCLAAAGHDDAEPALRGARELFAAMGYTQAVAEAEAILARLARTTV